MHRRALIGVIGGDKQGETARSLGRAAAAAGVILLTGGGDPTDIKLQPDEVKNAVFRGALDAEADGSGVARFVGVLPSGNVRWLRPRPRHCLLETGLQHFERNVINGVTPDVLVVMGGSRGTLAEAAFALAIPDALRATRVVESCPACGNGLLYVQRDFNQKAGLAVVVVGAALAPFTPFYSSLFVAAAIDAGLYALLPDVTVCYKCQAHLRGFARNAKHQPFDLHLAEQYATHDPAPGDPR